MEHHDPGALRAVASGRPSGGTRSDVGRDCRDAFLGLIRTCAKQGVAFWNYLGSRLDIAGQAILPPLAELVRDRARPA